MAAVTIDGLVKSFGTIEVLHGIGVAIADGEFVVLVGPSGCGKSTLLRMIAGLEEVTAGEIRIAGRLINDLEPKQRDIAMVFQSYALYPHMTCFENMAFGLKVARASRAEMEARVGRAAEILGLHELLDRYPRHLSGGQRQRVAMGRAIVRDPAVFLFDEPLSNLDAQLRVRMRAEIRDLHDRMNATTIYVTHDQIEAMTMADRIVVMNAGRIEQVGAPTTLFDRPENVFVAGFIGSPAMNLTRGRIVRDANGTSVETGDGRRLPLHREVGCETGRPVIYGLRPRSVSLVEGGGNAGPAIPVEISAVQPTGDETMLMAEIGGAPFTAVFAERLAVKAGDRIHLSPRPGGIHLFDAESGQRVESA